MNRNSQFNHIGIVTRPQTPMMSAVLNELIAFLRNEGLSVYLDSEAQADNQINPQQLQYFHVIKKSDMGRRCDLVIVLGGDGTLLSVARKLAPYRVPLIGIHQGHLGFLTQVPRAQMITELSGMLTGKYLPEERILLEATVVRAGEDVYHSLALNDVVLSRGALGQMIEFEVFINKEFVYTQRSDGLIVSTPTGSTAYALAAGGPILQPTLRAFSLVPICPQSMSNRPIAVNDTSEIEVLVTKGSDARAHFDGQVFFDLKSMDKVCINRYRNSLRILHPINYQYYKTLRQKLHWGDQLV
ncbi:NAD(+) kinase [Snodgrassella communis]|jgi:NAD+ kinase|uniref:NAD(+) kinase n=1 Tax=Snodgrassella communis TaxID=2946699 RepID=UPI000C1F51E8|nr:NAD(+) kinase [Snodgrassella communis]PIT22137.1 NAD kinase [Snodgrassella communis]